MDDIKLLKDSNLCRLCCAANNNGINIFNPNENSEDLSKLINHYLPIKVENDEKLPKTICPGCHIQLEATKLFLDLVVEGQKKLREQYQKQEELIIRQEKQRQKIEEALKTHNPTTSVKTLLIGNDNEGEKYILQIYTDGPLFPQNHEMSLRAEGLDKPKRKRGRPPKLQTDQTPATEPDKIDNTPPTLQVEEEIDGKRKRRIRAPVRYSGVVHGAELDNILKKEGVIDEDDTIIMQTTDQQKDYQLKEVIGKTLDENGTDLNVPVVHVRRDLSKKPSRPVILRKRRKYVCDVCNKDFLIYGRYQQHRSQHNIQYGCKENECNVKDIDKTIIEQHQAETGHSGISKFDCLDLIAGILELPPDIEPTKTMDLELEDKPESEKYSCEKCLKLFTCKQNLETHLSAVHNGDRPFGCDVCCKSFAYANSLKIHSTTHERDHGQVGSSKSTIYACNKCNKRFMNPSSLVYHRDTEHNTGRQYVCSKCNKTFKHRQLLKRHQLVHSDVRPYKCSKCQQAFKTKAILASHETVHSGEKKFCCPICGVNFAHRTSLSLHQKWHQGHKPFQCDVCKKLFSQKGNLLEHKRVHTGEKPYRCELCQRTFRTSSQFKLHHKTHTGEKPYQCEHCPRAFLHRDAWKVHVRRHLNERPYKCKQCPRAFTESWACKRHERIHFGEKPYLCNICNKAFSDKSNMTKHRRTHFNKNNNTTEVQLKDCDKAQSVNQLESTNIALSKPEVTSESPISLRQLLDQDGNPVSFTTAEGLPIPLVSSLDEKISGLLPDGTLIPINFLAGDATKSGETVSVEVPLENAGTLLDPVLDVENDNDSIVDVLSDNIQFITDDNGKDFCFITTIGGNQFLTINN